MSTLTALFDLSGRVPHGFCLTWDPELLWLHAGSDVLILLSYLSIPVSLIWLLRRRQDRTYRWIGHLFVLFIGACATTHGLDILTLWVPVYGLQGVAKAVTAAASVSTAAILWIMAPRLAAMLSPSKLTDLNAELSETVGQQKRTLAELHTAEQLLRQSIASLEHDLARRAGELRAAETSYRRLTADRAAINETLEKSMAEYQASFASATIGKVQIEPLSGHLVRVNAAFAAMLGYEVDSLVGRPIWDLAYPDDRIAARAQFDRLLVGEIDHWAMEKRMVCRDGAPVWVRISASVVIDPAIGLPRLAVADVEDLDVRHDIQAALRVTEMRLRQALDRLQLGVVEVDIRSGLFWVSARTSAMSGGEIPAETWLTVDGPKYLAWMKRVHPDDRDRRKLELRALYDGKSDVVMLEHRIRRADGLWSNLLHRYAVVERDSATGATVRAVGIVTDETSRLAAMTDAQAARVAAERDLARRNATIEHRRLLLREIYHRMAGALQSVGALLGDQIRTAEPSDVRQALWVQRARIAALGLVHSELMTQFDAAAVNVLPLLRDLTDTIRLDVDDFPVTAHISIQAETSNLAVAVDQTIPLCLLAAELLIGCATYMRPPIALSLRRASDAVVLTLTITHCTHAAGFLAELETRPVRDLVSQLGAALEISTLDGLLVQATFHG
jgi:PAS domain S-box-containing protein